MVTARVIAVGAGPSGVAAAYLLAQSGCSVTLVDRSADPADADRTRAFSYYVSKHGLPTLLRMGLGKELEEAAIRFDKTENLTFSAGQTPTKTSENPLKSDEARYWVSRKLLLEVMMRRLRMQGLVDIKLGVAAGSITYSRSGASVQLYGPQGEDAGVVHADLVLACDGMRTVVRRQLAKGDDDVESRCGFKMRKTSSASTGLLYKSLSFGPRPKFPPLPGDDGHHVVQPNELVCLRSRPTLVTQKSFVLLPMGKNGDESRLGNMAAPSEAPIWHVQTTDEAFDLLQSYFPQVDMRALVSYDEMTKYVEAKPGRFPEIQRCASLAGWCGENVGVALLGDAAKAFPPDLGQGVNSSLEDVVVLVDAVAEANSVRAAVQLYEKRRDRDIEALMRLVKIGFPYMYRQNLPLYHLQVANVIFRSGLSKFAPRLFNPPCLLLMEKSTYSDTVKKADETTLLLGILSVATVGAAVALIGAWQFGTAG